MQKVKKDGFRRKKQILGRERGRRGKVVLMETEN